MKYVINVVCRRRLYSHLRASVLVWFCLLSFFFWYYLWFKVIFFIFRDKDHGYLNLCIV